MLQQVTYNPRIAQTAYLPDGISYAPQHIIKPQVFKEKLFEAQAEYETQINSKQQGTTLQDMFEAWGNPTALIFKADGSLDKDWHMRLLAESKLGQMTRMQYITCELHEISGKLKEIAKTANSADYSGMSDAAIYKAIYDKYTEAFGLNFLKMDAVAYASLSSPDPIEIVKQFNKELKTVFGDSDRITAACRDSQYGNMSDSEVRQAIAEKYPPIGRITLREFYSLVSDLSRVGLDGGLPNILQRATSGAAPEINVFAREELLDRPLNMQWLSNTYNMMNNAMAKTHWNDVGSSDAVMRDLFGIGFNSNGSSSLYRTPDTESFSTLIKQLIQKYSEWTYNDYENWITNYSIN